ncbi:MAG: TlpA disulfide reductase family protein [Gemmatimonadota bacterium]
MRRIVAGFRRLFGLGAVLLLASCDGAGPGAAVAVGAPVPDFAAATLEGDTVTLAGLAGEHVLLNIWATWCVPCREEMPDLQEIFETYSDRGLRVVGVSIDQAYARGEVESFVERHDIGFTILHDAESRITRSYRTIGVPETFLISPEGTLIARWFGQIDPGAVRGAIEGAGLPPGRGIAD